MQAAKAGYYFSRHLATGSREMQLVNRMFARTRIVVLLLAGVVPLDGARAAEDVPVIEAPGVQAPATFAGGPVSPGLMAAIRAGSFEVVLRKTETDPLAYEKPLPMELLPFRSEEHTSELQSRENL